MRFRLLFWVVVFFACIVGANISYCQIPKNKIAPPSLKQANSYSLSSSEIEFIENKGQLADQNGNLMPEVLYSSNAKGMKCYLTSKGMHFVFSRIIHGADTSNILERTLVRSGGLKSTPLKSDSLILQRLDMDFAGANPHPRIEAQNMTEPYYNYYLAHCKLHGVRGYRKIIYHDLYPHIDFVIYNKDDGMKYDFIVHPGGDPNAIAMRYGGMDSMQCTTDGKFRIYSSLGKIEEDEPYTYQGIVEQIKISSRFFISDNELKFRIGKYDRTKDLVIDPPTRQWGTYYGGTGDDNTGSVVFDKSGNLIIVGTTTSNANIATTGAYQAILKGNGNAIIAQFNSSGALVWATYYGGNGGNKETWGYASAIDPNNNIIVGGMTGSTNGIATAGSYQSVFGGGYSDMFIAKFTNAGALSWGTYYGGGGTEDLSWGNGHVAVDSSSNIFIVGSTQSQTQIATPGAYITTKPINSAGETFLAKFDPNGVIQWGTYFDGPGYLGAGVAVDHSGNPTIIGYDGVEHDAYIARFNSSGGFLWKTLYGGEGIEDQFWGISISPSDTIYAVGGTNSTTGIATAGAYQTVYEAIHNSTENDAMLVKFTPSGVAVWGTYYNNGAPTANTIYTTFWSVATDSNNIYCAGYTNNTGLASNDGFQTTYGGGITDNFLVNFSPSCKRKWATYYGGEAAEGSNVGVHCDNTGAIALAGSTNSLTNISSAGAYQVNNGGNNDAYLVKFCGITTPILIGMKDTICPNTIDTLKVTGGSFTHIYWHDGAKVLSWLDDKTQYAIPDTLSAGLHSFTVVGEIAAGCDATSDTSFLFIHAKPTIYPGHDTVFCAGGSAVLRATVNTTATPYTFSWTPSTSLNNPNLLTPTATPVTTTIYHLHVMDAFGCTNEDSVIVKVNPQPTLILKARDTMCAGSNILIGDSAHGGTPPYFYSWSPAAGISTPTNPITYAFPNATTTYRETISDVNGCSAQANIIIVVKPAPTPAIIASGPLAFCKGDSVILRLDKNYKSYSWSDGSFADSLIVRQSGIYNVQVSDTNSCYGNANSVFVTVTPLHPVITPDSTISLCENGGAVLHAESGYASYLWNDGSKADSLIPKTPGKYFVSITDKNGCQGTSDTVLVKTSSLAPVISGANSACPQSLTSYLASGNKKDTYQWSLSGGGIIKNSSQPDSIDVQWTSAGTWTLHVTESNALGCSGDTSLTIIVSSTLVPVIKPNGNVSICEGDSIVLHAGKGFTNYSWSDGSTLDSLVIKKSGNYSVTVSGNGGCSGTSAVTHIAVNPIPSITITADGATHLCPGSSVHLSATSGLQNYLWSTGEITPTITVTKAGTYFVKVTNSSGCNAASLPIAITIDSSYHPLITGATSICIGEGAASYSIPQDIGATYLWSAINGSITNGQGTNSINLQWNDAAKGSGTLTVIEATSGGCYDTSILTIIIDANLYPQITANGPISFCDGDSVILDAGSGYATYQWSKDGSLLPGSTSEFLEVRQSGNYAVAVTNTSGCSGTSAALTVDVFPLPQKPVITQNNDILSSTPDAAYQWFFNGQIIPGDTNEYISASINGSYTVSITNVNGCSNTSDPFQILMKNATAIVAVGNVLPANPGSKIEVPIELISSQNLIPANANHYVGSMRYNGTMLVPTGSRNGTLLQSIASANTYRTIGFEGFSTPISSGTLQWIEFDAVLGNDTCSSLTIDTFYWTDANVSVTRENGNFCESGICIAGGTIRLIDASGKFGISPIRPNPSSSHITIEYDLTETGRTKLMLSDALGRTIRIIKEEDELAGHYREDVSLEEISSGYYQVGLKTPSQFLMQSFVVQK